MVCIYCHSPTHVTNSRPNKQTNAIWRRRACKQCGAIFTSYEVADLSNSLVVQYSPKDLRHFVREQLFMSIYECCKHRPDAIEAATALSNTVISFLIKHVELGKIERDMVAAISHEIISRYDPVAGSVYQAYHPY